MEQVERARLTKQCQAILARLQQGPATNKELAGISLKYTGRISDLRAAGYGVENYDRNPRTGLSWYRLATGEAESSMSAASDAVTAAFARMAGRLF